MIDIHYVKSTRLFVSVIAVVLLLQSCGGGSGGASTPTVTPPPPPASFNALLAMSMHNGGVDATDNNYIEDYDLAQSIGINAAQVLIPWSAFEPTAGTYNSTFLTNSGWGLDALSARGLKILFTFSIIDVASKTVPADISGLALNDPTMKSRYQNAISQILPYLNDDVIYFSVGNEVDTRLVTNAGEWSTYKELVDDAIDYIHLLRPDMQVGVTTTFENSVTEAANIATLNSNTDVHIMTYYLTDSSFVVRGPPSTVLADMDTMVTQAAGKPLVLQEIGYPSATANGGSEIEQAEFVEHVFTKWQSIGASQLPYLAFFKQKNWNSDFCGTITGQVSPHPFWEFMCSLGFTNNDRSAKPAWTTMIDQIDQANLQ